MSVDRGKKQKESVFLERKRFKKTFIPLSALQKRPLTILEAVITYLKEETALSYRELATLINRDERNVRDVYLKAQKKSIKQEKQTTTIIIPVSIFTNRILSPLEVLVTYLKEVHSLTYHELAVLLKRNDRTIWTVYQRARKKNMKREMK